MFRKKSDGTAKKSPKVRKVEELILPASKLRFCPEQLLNLNYIFDVKLTNRHTTNSANERSLLLAKSVAERLVQRLICAAGSIDSRFASKFLINIKETTNNTDVSSANLAYLLRLDALSTPRLYQTDDVPNYIITESDADYPPAYARLRLQNSAFKLWGEYANPGGFLRRDKMQARLVELLALAAGRDGPNSPLNVDESICCGSPGKIVDAFTLEQILKVPPEEQVYYGPGGNVPRFPDPRDFRLAIIDEPKGIKLKVEFLSPALSSVCVNVRLLLAIGVDSWPSTTDFPHRIPLGHPDCLISHQAAQTGLYLVGYGVQSSAWQMRVPAAESILLNHHSCSSTVRSTLEILYSIIDDINKARNLRNRKSYRILNKYIIFTTLLEDMETTSINPSFDLLTWSPLYTSTITLRLLDKIIASLNCQLQPNYFFKSSNLLVNPGHLCEDDYIAEANVIKSYILRLFDESLMSTKSNETFGKMMTTLDGEMTLLEKWRELIDGLLPPAGTRGRRFCFVGSKGAMDMAHSQYTMRQLEYIGTLLQNMLHVKQHVLQVDHQIVNHQPPNPQDDNTTEDVIYLLVTIMDQARDQYLKTQISPNSGKNKTKIKNQFNTCTMKLVDLIRKDKEISSLDLSNDLLLVKTVLKWLYKALDQSKKYLAPILRPYLNHLFTSSHNMSWYLESIKSRQNVEEVKALGAFCKLVNDKEITPAQGLVDSVNKNWGWAKDMLRMVEKGNLRVIFVPGRGKVVRHILAVPNLKDRELEEGSRTCKNDRKDSNDRKRRTLPNRNYFDSMLRKGSISNEESPKHCQLRDSSPLTFVLKSCHRRGEHRNCGDIFQALVYMQKLNIFQEATSGLPQEDRLEIMEVIQNIQTARNKKSWTRKWSTVSARVQQKRYNLNEPLQRYTPKEESAGIPLTDKQEKGKSKEDENTLISKCRAARIKEDSAVFVFQDDIKIKSLLKKSESFKN